MGVKERAPRTWGMRGVLVLNPVVTLLTLIVAWTFIIPLIAWPAHMAEEIWFYKRRVLGGLYWLYCPYWLYWLYWLCWLHWLHWLYWLYCPY